MLGESKSNPNAAIMAKRILQDHPPTSQLSSIKEDSNFDEMVDSVKRWLDHPKNARWLRM